LQENFGFLRQKICLMALIEAVFKRHANNRSMSFEVIADETRLPVNEVEHLVMKALRWVFISLSFRYFSLLFMGLCATICVIVSGLYGDGDCLHSSPFSALPPLFAFILHPIQPNPI
jgi:hypothetical protein